MGYYFFSGLLLIWYPPILRWREPRKDAQKKVVHFPMKAKWYDAIKNGTKTCELRAASNHWLTRVEGATHCSFTLGFSTNFDAKLNLL